MSVHPFELNIDTMFCVSPCTIRLPVFLLLTVPSWSQFSNYYYSPPTLLNLLQPKLLSDSLFILGTSVFVSFRSSARQDPSSLTRRPDTSTPEIPLVEVLPVNPGLSSVELTVRDLPGLLSVIHRSRSRTLLLRPPTSLFHSIITYLFYVRLFVVERCERP